MFVSRLKIVFWKVTNSRQERSLSVKSLFAHDVQVEFGYCRFTEEVIRYDK